ncbi:MAG: hypothetical protein ACRDNK_16110 [Solirubrobacteraceae bacterium]
MTRDEIHLSRSLAELDAWTNAHCADPYDEPMRDLDWEPMSDEQVLALVRRIEKETGKQLVFRRGERSQPAA